MSDAKKKTRFEENQEILDALAEVFIEPVGDQLKCVFRPRARGKGIIINKEYIQELRSKLWKVKDNIMNQSESQALEEMGLSKFKKFYIYEQINPNKLSEEELHKQWEEYTNLKNTIETDLMNQETPKLKDEAMCVHIGEDIKSKESGSMISYNVLMGTQTDFLSDEEEAEAKVIAIAFNDLLKHGNIFLHPEEPEHLSRAALGIVSAETIIKMNKEKNAILKRIINPKLKKKKEGLIE